MPDSWGTLKYTNTSLAQPPANFKIDMKAHKYVMLYYIILIPGHGSSVFSCQILHDIDNRLSIVFIYVYTDQHRFQTHVLLILVERHVASHNFVLLDISGVSIVYTLYCTYGSSTQVSSSCTTVT